MDSGQPTAYEREPNASNNRLENRIKSSKSRTFLVNICLFYLDRDLQMKTQRIQLLLAMLATLVAAGTAPAQDDRFQSPDVDYVFELPDQRWKMTVKPSATTPNVEFVYGDRTDGHLEVRRLTLPARGIVSDVIRDEEQKLQFLPGYVAGKEEPFGGFLNGAIFNFEFIRAGRPMSGRFYFLKAADDSVYVLRFTGFRDKLRSIRHQTDLIARTFNIKK